MDQTASQFLGEFVLEQIATQPTPKRIMLYRAFALETRDEGTRKICREIADELQLLDEQHARLLEYFSRKQKPSQNGK